MYKAYLFNNDGRYQAPIYLETDQSVLPFVFRYKDIVPRIMITQSDESVLEVEEGAIVFPELSLEDVDLLKKSVVPLADAVTIEKLMETYQDRVNAFTLSKGKDKAIYQSMVTIENDLFALAARDNINLSALGWKNSGIIEAELDAAYDVI